jgi:glutamine synthetase
VIPDGVQWVRLSFVDVFGAPNSVQVSVARYPEVVAVGQPFDGSALEGRARHLESDMLLRPDPDTLVDLGHGIARVICGVETPDGSTWRGDPRHVLESLLAEGDWDGFTVSAELELFLLAADGRPADAANYFDEAHGAGSQLMRDVITQLDACGVAVESWHHEAGAGQYELDLGPAPPLQLADHLVLAKQLLRETAAGDGLTATFMPRPFDDQPGSGLHLHQRMASRLLDANGRLDEQGRAFVAGQLDHAAGLCALAAPTINSYKRLHAGPEAPSAVGWAHTNRGALLRVSSYRGPEASIEYRGADPSANPYLVLAALLVAGADGINRTLELPAAAEEQETGFDPAQQKVRVRPLPRSLDDALDALLADDTLVDALDAQLLARFVDGRRAESDAYRGVITDWERSRYLDDA